jgi:hypothetical protein
MSMPELDFIKLHLDLVSAVPEDAKGDWVTYPDSILIKDIGPKIPVDLPSIGADAIDPEILECFTSQPVGFDEIRGVRESVLFRFYTFKDGESWVAPEDKRLKYPFKTSRPLNDYVLISPVEAPPFIVQHLAHAHNMPNVPKHMLSTDEAIALGEIVLDLTPKYIKKESQT